MASIVEDLKRNIIPLWRGYEETAKVGELAYAGNNVLPIRFERFPNYLGAWGVHHSIMSAANLISAAMASDNTSLDEVKKAAEFICQNSEASSPLAVDVAQFILADTVQKTEEDKDKEGRTFDDHALLLLNGLEKQENKIKARIGLLRTQLRDFSYNAITYCELARCYSDLGFNEKAQRYMLCAVQLAPHNRYVSRCAARFFVHIGDAARARKILINNGWVNSDPWVMASEIAVTSVLNRSSNFIKTGRQLLLSDHFSPYSSSELCFAICKEDYKADKRKDWQKMFKMGLRAPNDNSLAQAEFFVKKEARLRFDYGQYGAVEKKNEADTWNFFNTGRYEDAFLSAVSWMHDYRFSHEPIAFAYDISCTILKKYNYTVEIIKRWLATNPQDYAMMNNIVYVLGLSDRIEEAEQYLSKISIKQQLEDKIENGICFLATKGLIEYRKGNIEDGRAYYQLSIDTAKRIRNKDLASKARLNMIREEVRNVDEYDESILKEMETLNTGIQLETEQLRKDILKEVKKKGEKKESK